MTQNTVKKCSENASKKVQNSKIFLERKKNREEGEGKRKKKEQKERERKWKKKFTSLVDFGDLVCKFFNKYVEKGQV